MIISNLKNAQIKLKGAYIDLKVATFIQLIAICQDTCNLATVTSNLKVKSCSGTNFEYF
jgi:hypothetical protein